MRRGVETIAAGRKERPYGVFTSYVAFDRTDEGQLARALAQTEPDVLLDLACYQPREIEAVGRQFKGQRYVFISTGVYPDLHGQPAREEDFVPLHGEPPATLEYLDGKRWSETLLARNRDLPWTVVRPPAVFGPGDPTLRIAAYIQRVADGGRRRAGRDAGLVPRRPAVPARLRQPRGRTCDGRLVDSVCYCSAWLLLRT